MDLTLLLTVGIIFLTTLVGSVLRGLRKDRCLQDFDDFHVTVQRKDGHRIWGTMRLEPTGFELEYREDVLDEQMHVETSYTLYKREYATIQAIYRYVDDLTAQKRKQRNVALHRAFHPNLIRYLVRWVRNFTNTATDSLTEAFGLMAGKAAPSQQLLAPGQTHLKGLTKDILGYVGTNYDPLLEKFVGVQVVAEIAEGDVVQEYVGILKDYTGEFLEMLDVYVPQTIKLTMDTPKSSDDSPESSGRPRMATISVLDRDIRARVEGRVLTVQNRASSPALLFSIKVGQESRMVNAVIEAKGSLSYPLPDVPEHIELTFKAVREVDMIVPRAHALIRHRAERYQPSDAFSIPVALNLTSEHKDEERRARDRLESDPEDAETALNLGLLLVRSNETREAAHWLGYALEMRDRLPDGGLLASHQLQRLLCKRHQLSED